jgi:hypothetical protein
LDARQHALAEPGVSPDPLDVRVQCGKELVGTGLEAVRIAPQKSWTVHVSVGSMLLKKAKMNRSKFLPVLPSKPVFRNPMHHRELTKAAGWKSD